jgi:hypothetical protein
MNAELTNGFRRRCPGCFEVFTICQACDRGHRYCGKVCSRNGRQNSLKRSSKLFQLSPAGKKSHRDRQKRYRKNRRLKETVTQHSSEIPKKSLGGRLVTVTRDKRQKRQNGFSLRCRSEESTCSLCQRVVRWYFNTS